MLEENHNLESEFDVRNVKKECQDHLYHHVLLTMNDGRSFDGIIEQVDDDQMTVLVGEDVLDREDGDEGDRQYYGYGYPRPRYRRFRRQVLPLALLAALSLLPYGAPYPYYPYY